MFRWPQCGLSPGLIDGAVQVIDGFLNLRETVAITKRNDALQQSNFISYSSEERCYRLIQ